MRIPLHVNKAQCMRCLGAEVLLIMVEDVIWRRRIVEYSLKVIIFVFFAQKKYSCSFIKLWLNHWIILLMSLLHFWVWEHSVALLSVASQKTLGFH